MTRKSIYDRYTSEQLTNFSKSYKFNLDMGLDKFHAAAAAGISTLYTVKEWNSKNGVACFDDALSCASRIEAGFYDLTCI